MTDPVANKRHLPLSLWVTQIRNSETFGRGSCTTVDEATEDSELRAFLNDYDTFEEAWAMLVAVEEIHWERCGISWDKPEGIK